jgi:broad-specificity NMP kinase
MDFYPYVMHAITLFVAGMAVVGATFALIKPYFDRSEKIQLLELKKALANQTLPLRLQAYERAVLFVERVNPANLLIRLNANAYSAAQLHSMAVAEIRDEYQHNVSQQIYMTTRAWSVVRRAKEDTLSIITNAVKGMPEGASGLDLSRTVLGHLSSLEENPYDIAAAVIRQDLDNIL